jgi:NAD(P)-dependent dehydrogenase (short-subunit alcohol dehydrogenase family)
VTTLLTVAVLITGASPGSIGAETAYSLASNAKPGLLLLAGRNAGKVQPVLDNIKAKGVRAEFLQLDLSKLESVRECATQLIDKKKPVDVLINNAAVMAVPTYETTVDGFERQFATNYLGPFLFTNLLVQSGMISERIVNVSSSASVRSPEYLLRPLDDLSYGQGATYDPVQAYSVSKFALVLYARSLAAKLKARHISVFSLNPGSILTGLQQYMTTEIRQAAIEAAQKEDPNFQVPVRKTLQQGCATQLRAALDPELVKDSGAYLDHCQIFDSDLNRGAFQSVDRLWDLSEKMVGTTFNFSS